MPKIVNFDIDPELPPEEMIRRLKIEQERCVDDARREVVPEEKEKLIRSAMNCQRMYLDLQKKLGASAATHRQIAVKWTSEMTDEFLTKHIGACPAIFPA